MNDRLDISKIFLKGQKKKKKKKKGDLKPENKNTTLRTAMGPTTDIDSQAPTHITCKQIHSLLPLRMLSLSIANARS